MTNAPTGTDRRRHVVISGTGRAGTTFLVELFTHLGLETGFTTDTIKRHKHALARAGLERDVRDDNAPYIIKSPWFCDSAAEIIHRSDIVIEHVFIPMRDLFAAAESRRFVQRNTLAKHSLVTRIRRRLRENSVSGGLWHTTHDNNQELVLLEKNYKLALALSNSNIAVTLLQYPRLTRDCQYLYEKVQCLLRGMTYAEFESIFKLVSKPSLVHQFQRPNSTSRNAAHQLLSAMKHKLRPRFFIAALINAHAGQARVRHGNR